MEATEGNPGVKYRIVPEQTSRDDTAGNLLPILDEKMTFTRATPQESFKEGAY